MLQTDYQKPIPFKTLDNAPYWDAADRHELSLQFCKACDTHIHPAGPSCPSCGQVDFEWENYGSEIKGTVYSYVVSYRPFLPGFQDDLPLIIAQVELDNIPGVQIIGNILNCSDQEVKIGMPVEMIWIDVNEERAIPQWQPLSE